MKLFDINKRYTEKVAEYLAKGYTIHSATMSGSQGEIAKIDLTDGNELIRIYLDNGTDYGSWGDDSKWHGDFIKLVIGRWTKEFKVNSANDTVWMNDLEVVDEIKFYRLDRWNNWYTDSLEEALVVQTIQSARSYNKHKRSFMYELSFVGDKVNEIATKAIKRKLGYKRVSWEDIKVAKRFDADNKVKYVIRYKNNTIILGCNY